MATLISMELSPAEAKQENPAEPEAPKYPWGLSLNLDEVALEKLGITTLPEVGTKMSIVARAEVDSVNTNQYQGEQKKRMNLSLQITELAITPEAADAAGLLYGGK